MISRNYVPRITHMLFALVFVLPFIHIDLWYDPFEYPKFLLFIIGIQIVLWYFVIKQIQKPSQPIRMTPLSLCIMLFLTCSFITDITGLDPRASLLGNPFRHQGFITLLAGGFLYLLMQQRQREKDSKAFLSLINVCAVLLSTITIFQGILYHIFHVFVLTYHGRIIGTFGNPDFLAAYLVCLFPFMLFTKNLPFTFSKIWFFTMKRVVSLMVFLSLILTGSRSGLLAFGITLLIFILRLKHTYLKYFFLFLVLAAFLS